MSARGRIVALTVGVILILVATITVMKKEKRLGTEPSKPSRDLVQNTRLPSISDFPQNLHSRTAESGPAHSSDDFVQRVGGQVAGTGVDPSEILNQTWDARQVSVILREAENVRKVVGNLPLHKRTQVTEPQLETLRQTVSNMLIWYGNDDLRAYFGWLKESGETARPDLLEAIKETLGRRRGVPGSQVTGDPWELMMERYGNESITWLGLVAEESQISVYDTTTAKLPPMGEVWKETRKAIRSFNACSTPPVSLEDTIRTQGRATIAEAQVFIAHQGQQDMPVRPYIMRFWHEPSSNQWRRLDMVCFEGQNDKLPGLPTW